MSTIAVDLHAQFAQCHTITSGGLNDPGIWDCGCSPNECDTLYLGHTVSSIGETIIASPLLVVEPTGILQCPDTMIFVRNVWIQGVVDAGVLIHSDTANWLRIDGTLQANDAFLYPDSVVNSGIFHVQDTLYNYPGTSIHNTGSLTGSVLLNLNARNEGLLYFDMVRMYAVLENTGTVQAAVLHATGLLDNHVNGMVEVDTLWELAGGILNNGMIRCKDLLSIGSLEVPSGNMNVGWSGNVVATGDLTVYGSIGGSGEICVGGTSANYGNITGTLAICDASLTVTSPPFVDVDLGSVSSSVQWCDEASCFSGVMDVQASTPAVPFPNPAYYSAHVPAARPVRTQLFDHLGHQVSHHSIWTGTDMFVERGSLPAGSYVIRSSDGTTFRIEFLDP